MTFTSRRRTILGLGLAVCALFLGTVGMHRRITVTQGSEPPEGLPIGVSVGRAVDDGVDVVMWDGASWRPVVPPSVIQPLVIDDDVLEPSIRAVHVSSDLDLLALWVVFCGDSIEERDPCTARAYVYDIDDRELIPLRDDVAPVAWLSNGHRLLVEDFMVEFGAEFDVGTGRYDEMLVPDSLYSLPQTSEGVSRDGDLVAFSGEEGDGIVRRSSGDVAWLQTTSAHNTSWMALSPNEQLAAVVNIRDGEDNRLGGGELALFGHTGALIATATNGSAHLDFNPAWADVGDQLGFLRADAAALRRNVMAYGSDAQNLPAAVMSFHVGSQATVTVLPADKVRRALVAPGVGQTLLFLQRDGSRDRAYYVALSGGPAQPLLTDGFTHTAIGTTR